MRADQSLGRSRLPTRSSQLPAAGASRWRSPPRTPLRAPSVEVVHDPLLPGAEPRLGLVKEGINVRHVVARPHTGGRELLVPNIRSCQRGLPYPEEGVADGLKERINLLWVIARPHAGDGKSLCPGPLGPLGESPVANLRQRLQSGRGSRLARRDCAARSVGRRLCRYGTQRGDRSSAQHAVLRGLSGLLSALRTSHCGPRSSFASGAAQDDGTDTAPPSTAEHSAHLEGDDQLTPGSPGSSRARARTRRRPIAAGRTGHRPVDSPGRAGSSHPDAPTRRAKRCRADGPEQGAAQDAEPAGNEHLAQQRCTGHYRGRIQHCHLCLFVRA